MGLYDWHNVGSFHEGAKTPASSAAWYAFSKSGEITSLNIL